jgi:hypothetical protein
MEEFATVGPRSGARAGAPSPTSRPTHAVSSARSGASARAAALTARARALGAAQAEVHSLTMTEIVALARAAANFFDALPLPEFSGTLLPASARGARRIRHKVLHQAMVADESGATLRALLLGRDAQLRIFSARSSVARDFMSAIEPGQGFLAGINRDVADWTPRMRVPEFRPADVLDRLSAALDEVEQRLAIAERRIAAQRDALAHGDFDRIRDSLGTSPVAQPGIPPESMRPAALRLTPGMGTRAIRPPAAAPAIASPQERPQLAAGAPVAPADTIVPAAADAVRDVDAPGTTAPVAASAAAPPVSVPVEPVVTPATSESSAPSALPLAAAAPAARPEPPPAPTPDAAVQGQPKGIAWLSRAVRAALRTPPPVGTIPETPDAGAKPSATADSTAGAAPAG